MSTTFRSDLSILKASAGSPVDLQRIENETIRVALEEQRVLLSSQATQLKRLTDIIQRRTTVLSPTQGYSQEQYVCSGAQFDLVCSTIIVTQDHWMQLKDYRHLHHPRHRRTSPAPQEVLTKLHVSRKMLACI